MKKKRDEIEWRPAPGYEKLYECSSEGEVRGVKRMVNSKSGIKREAKSKIMVQEITRRGYLKATLSNDGRCKSVHVHRLVALAFIPNPENKPQVNHKDGNKCNNRVENLEWNTRSENMLHAYAIGIKSNKGDKHPQSLLTSEMVLKIRNSKKTCVELGAEYKVTKSAIQKIRQRKIWTHI